MKLLVNGEGGGGVDNMAQNTKIKIHGYQNKCTTPIWLKLWRLMKLEAAHIPYFRYLSLPDLEYI